MNWHVDVMILIELCKGRERVSCTAENYLHIRRMLLELRRLYTDQDEALVSYINSEIDRIDKEFKE